MDTEPVRAVRVRCVIDLHLLGQDEAQALAFFIVTVIVWWFVGVWG